MEDKFYTINEAAQRLSLHHKTVRKFISEGRLHATRAGKQWRITHADLAAFMANHSNERENEVQGEDFNTLSVKGEKLPESRKQRIHVSTVIEIESVDKEQSMRITNTLIALMNSRDPEIYHATLHAKYQEEGNRLKILLWGPLKFTEEMLDYISRITD